MAWAPGGVLTAGLGGGAVTALGALGAWVHAAGRRRPALDGQAPRPAVVLGARVYADGTPSPALVERVSLGVQLLNAGVATALVLSGGTPDGRPTEAQVMAGLARELGAPAPRLWLEAESRSTFENARACARLLEARGVPAVWLVTCDFHVARAAAQFRRAGIDVTAVPSVRALSTPRRLTVTAREVAALLRRPALLRHLR